MALSLYAGPLTRYLAGDWQTADAGPRPALADAAGTPYTLDSAHAAALGWQGDLLKNLGVDQPWPDEAGLDYWALEPEQASYNGLRLLAAYQEQPDLMPRKGIFKRPTMAADVLDLESSDAFRAASANPTKYLTLLSGVRHWLPLTGVPQVFTAPGPDGATTTMGTVTGLRLELAWLAEALGVVGMLGVMLTADPDPSDAASSGSVGLAQFSELARVADEQRQPLVLG